MVDYSKWDRLEISDDSDVEVHPNVDKRSFIRAKQRMIHEERQKRKIEIEQLQIDRKVNDNLLERIQKLIDWIKNRDGNVRNPEELVMQALVRFVAIYKDETKPAYIPPSSHLKNQQPVPSYNQMMSSLLDMIKKEVDEMNVDDRWQGYITALEQHYEKVVKLNAECAERLVKLEKEDNAKITSESYHTGFSSGYVNKSASSSTPKKTTAQKVTTVEQLNPGVNIKQDGGKPIESASSGAEADVEEVADEEDPDSGSIRPTALGYEFSKIPMSNYKALFDFISHNPSVVAEKEENGLLIEAFNSEQAGKHQYAKQCVHHALLLQYCRQLGASGVQIFFKRITTKNHQAQQVFHKDVAETYHKLCQRAKDLAAEKAQDNGSVEQIQLQAVEPGTSINIVVPPKDSDDPEQQKNREIFDALPPGLQRALESGSLEEVNKVLAKMSVEEAEEIVAKLGEGGMLSLEGGIIDATTEEGKAKIEEIERNAKSKEKFKEEDGIPVVEEDEEGEETA